MTGEWVKCSELMPKEGQPIYYYRGLSISKSVREGVYTTSRSLDYPFSGDGPSVTHWMPREIVELPEPPKESN